MNVKDSAEGLTNKELSSLHVSRTDFLCYPADVHPQRSSLGRKAEAGRMGVMADEPHQKRPNLGSIAESQ